MVKIKFKKIYILSTLCCTLGSTLAFVGCGQSGPLYMPAESAGKFQQGV